MGSFLKMCALLLVAAMLVQGMEENQGTCANMEDIKKLMDQDLISKAMETCPAQCVQSESDPSKMDMNVLSDCASKCIQEETDLSPACAQCFGTSARCAIENCAEACQQGAESESCKSCFKENCESDLRSCVGY